MDELKSFLFAVSLGMSLSREYEAEMESYYADEKVILLLNV